MVRPTLDWRHAERNVSAMKFTMIVFRRQKIGLSFSFGRILSLHANNTVGRCHLATIETCGDLIESEDYSVYQKYTFSPFTVGTAGSFYSTIYSLTMNYFNNKF